MAPSSATRLRSLLGLLVALGGLPLVNVLRHLMLGAQPAHPAAGMVFDLAVEWLILAGIVALTLKVEHLGAAGLGLRRFSWGAVAAGIVLGVALFALSTATMILVQTAGLPDVTDATPAGTLMALSLPLRIAAVITAGVVEETLYRGYAIERLGAITGRYWLAGLVSLAAFSAIHAIFWGRVQIIVVWVDAAALTAIYLWRRNLLLNIIAHVVTDGIPFVVFPLLHH